MSELGEVDLKQRSSSYRRWTKSKGGGEKGS